MSALEWFLLVSTFVSLGCFGLSLRYIQSQDNTIRYLGGCVRGHQDTIRRLNSAIKEEIHQVPPEGLILPIVVHLN